MWQCAHINLLKSNAKSTWKLLNDLINKKKIKCKLLSVLKANEQEILNPTQTANRFCEYFTNTGPNLAKSILASDKSHRKEALLIHFFFNRHQNKKLLRFVVAFNPVLLQDMIVFQ